jgi:hypothetical protein
MTPDQALNSLRRQLAAHGEPVTIRRLARTSPALAEASVSCRGFVRPFGQGQQKVDLIGSVAQQDVNVIISPDEIVAAGWTSGGQSGLDPRLPIKGNKITIAGKERNIEAAHPIILDGVLVRIEMQARG